MMGLQRSFISGFTTTRSVPTFRKHQLRSISAGKLPSTNITTNPLNTRSPNSIISHVRSFSTSKLLADSSFPPIRLRRLPTLTIPSSPTPESLKSNFIPSFTTDTPTILPTASFATPANNLPPCLQNWVISTTAQLNVPYFDSLEASGTPLGMATLDTLDPSILSSPAPAHIDPSQHKKYTQSHLPLSLYFHLISSTTMSRTGVPSFLYLSQHPVPNALKNDCPAPALAFVGKNDIYSTTMWAAFTKNVLTSLHWDPNHNIFLQVGGRKKFRLIRSDVIQGEAGMKSLKDESTDEMEAWVWGKGEETIEEVGDVNVGKDGMVDVFEVDLKPGEGLFIPRGWWHTVRGSGNPLSHNVSVNWWFR